MLSEFNYDIELKPGEALSLRKEAAQIVGPGHWLISIRPADESAALVRDHTAFLKSYVPDDEGLYDDCSSR
jgi:hypothetical protein